MSGNYAALPIFEAFSFKVLDHIIMLKDKSVTDRSVFPWDLGFFSQYNIKHFSTTLPPIIQDMEHHCVVIHSLFRE